MYIYIVDKYKKILHKPNSQVSNTGPYGPLVSICYTAQLISLFDYYNFQEMSRPDEPVVTHTAVNGKAKKRYICVFQVSG